LHLDIGAQVDLLENVAAACCENRYTVVIVTHELNLVGEYAGTRCPLAERKASRCAPASVYQRDLLEQVFQTQLTVSGLEQRAEHFA